MTTRHLIGVVAVLTALTLSPFPPTSRSSPTRIARGVRRASRRGDGPHRRRRRHRDRRERPPGLREVQAEQAVLLSLRRRSRAPFFSSTAAPSVHALPAAALEPRGSEGRCSGPTRKHERSRVSKRSPSVRPSTPSSKPAAEGRTIYVPFRQESIGAVATDRVRSFERSSEQDPWDGRKSKETVFARKIQAIATRSESRRTSI